jgi:hypothetical protein
MIRFYEYIAYKYGQVKNFSDHYNQVMLSMDGEIIGLFCKILKDRLIIMDDLEFLGKR